MISCLRMAPGLSRVWSIGMYSFCQCGTILWAPSVLVRGLSVRGFFSKVVDMYQVTVYCTLLHKSEWGERDEEHWGTALMEWPPIINPRGLPLSLSLSHPHERISHLASKRKQKTPHNQAYETHSLNTTWRTDRQTDNQSRVKRKRAPSFVLLPVAWQPVNPIRTNNSVFAVKALYCTKRYLKEERKQRGK